jgi:hypothetical protein
MQELKIVFHVGFIVRLRVRERSRQLSSELRSMSLAVGCAPRTMVHEMHPTKFFARASLLQR